MSSATKLLVFIITALCPCDRMHMRDAKFCLKDRFVSNCFVLYACGIVVRVI